MFVCVNRSCFMILFLFSATFTSYVGKSELDKSVVMAWVGSPAQSQMRLFLEYPIPRKSGVTSLKKTWPKHSRVTWLLLIC